MTSRGRNLAILGVVAVLLVLAALVIVPGTPLSKDTKLGLDLEGGIELVYEGRPTPQVPEVTPQAVDDAIETMRKRVDALGVSEPEIQRSGQEQISVGLPDVQNAERARQQVGTTAQLQFYDWEPNLLTDTEVYSGGDGLYDATLAASKEKGKAEQTDVVPGSGDTPEEADRNNNTQADRYYLFGPDQAPIGPDKQPVRTENYEPSATCEELLAEYDAEPGEPNKYHKDTECLPELEALGPGGPPDGSRVIKVPEGVVVVEQERQPNQPPQIKRFTVLEDDSELSGEDIKNPEANTDPNTSAPLVSMEFTDEGREAFARVTKRIADRGFNAATLNPGVPRDQFLQSFAITLDDQIVSLATIDFQENPEGIDGRTGAQIEGVGSFDDANDLAESLRIGALPIELKLISETQISASLGQQALDQGLAAGAAGLVLMIIFLIVFYRVLGLVATAALLIYAVLLFALVKLIPITLTLPGIAGMVLTLAVAADANIVMYERIKEEVRAGHGRGEGLRVHARDRHDRLAVHGRARHLGHPRLDVALAAAAAALGTRRRARAGRLLALRLHGQVALVLLRVGGHPGGGRAGDRRPRDQLRHRLRVGHADHRAARTGGERGRRARRARSARLRQRQDPAGRRPGGDRRGVGRLLLELDRAHLRGADRPDGADRRDRLAAPDRDLHRVPVRGQVRDTGADRAGARPPDHRGRVRPDREGADHRHGGRSAHDHGVLALRHDHRVRPNTRERAAHAAGHVLPDREPVDVGGADAIAGHELHGADAGRRAAPVRRRDAEGLRVRSARGGGVGRLLVDLHRHACAGRVEGARAGLHAPAPPRDGAARRAGARVRDRLVRGGDGRARARGGYVRRPRGPVEPRLAEGGAAAGGGWPGDAGSRAAALARRPVRGRLGAAAL